MKVVCLVNTRNHVAFIDQCVRSCLAQQVPADCEYAVHAIDAGSSDGTLEKLQGYGSVTVHARDNIGQSGAFNLCLDIEADVFVFCDGDDFLSPQRVSRVVDVLRSHADVILVGNSIEEVDAAGHLIRAVRIGADRCFDARASGDVDPVYRARCLLGTSRLAVRKQALAQVLPFARVVLFEADEYLFNILPALGRICILGEVLTSYRLHGANNYQNPLISVERLARYRCVHEEILQAMLQACDRLGLTQSAYVEKCAAGVREVCRRVGAYEDALRSRRTASALVLHRPEVLGFSNSTTLERRLFAAIVWVLGLRPSMLLLTRLRSVMRRPPASADVCLL